MYWGVFTVIIIALIHYIVDVLKYDVLLLAHVIHVSDSNEIGRAHV